MSRRTARSTLGTGTHAPTDPPGFFGDGLSTGAWCRLALRLGGLGILASAPLGGMLGLALGVEWGGIVGLCVAALAGIAYGMMRLGGPGFGLGLVTGTAALLGAMELRHAVVCLGPIDTLPSLADWAPRTGATRVRLAAEVVRDPRFESTVTETHRGSRGGSTTIAHTATPLLEGPRIVGFTCIVSARPGHSAARGHYVVSVEARDGVEYPGCEEAVALAARWAERSGVALADGAPDRIVRVYPTEAALRADHDAGKSLYGPAIFLAVYVAGVLGYRLYAARRTPP